MFPSQDKMSNATKSQLEANLALYTSLTGKTLESLEKLASLNFTAVKAAMEESADVARRMLAAKDAQEVLKLASAQAKPNFEKALAYGSHVANIISGTQTEFRDAAQAQMAEISRKTTELVQDSTKGVNLPFGNDSMTSVMQAMFTNAGSGYEQFAKATRQAMETGLNNAVSTFSAATTQKATSKN